MLASGYEVHFSISCCTTAGRSQNYNNKVKNKMKIEQGLLKCLNFLNCFCTFKQDFKCLLELWGTKKHKKSLGSSKGENFVPTIEGFILIWLFWKTRRVGGEVCLFLYFYIRN